MDIFISYSFLNNSWYRNYFLFQTVTLDIQLPEETENSEIESLPHEEKLTKMISVLSQALKDAKSGQWTL